MHKKYMMAQVHDYCIFLLFLVEQHLIRVKSFIQTLLK